MRADGTGWLGSAMYASVAARLCALYAAGAMLSGCLFTDRLLLAYIDSDSDGYFEDGFPGSRTWDEGTDCNDNDPAINGGQPELCGDGIDNDCNGEIDESGVGDIVVYADVDKDGFGNPNNNKEACTPDADWVTNDDDCDDQNNIINPLMEEACDGLDNDCDKIVDDNAPQTPWYEDLDGDSFGTPARVELSCQPPSGFVPNPDDCDDANASVFPGADDVPYDGVDADCATDSDYDLDRDGYLHAASGTAAPDCDDDDASIHPGSAEVWYDSVDQDCDPLTEWDQDRDGFEVIPHGADCDDLNPLRRPGAPETWYDGIDQDCDPATEWDQDGDGLTVVTAPVGGADDCDDRTPAVLGPSLWYPDVDQDGWGDPLRYVTACAQPAGHVARPDDCDDTVSTIHPEAPETCAPGDEDCDGLTDEDGGNLWYLDNDGDGFGDARFRGIETCHPPANTAERGEDCDDTRPEVHPGATEVCNGLDDDCDREFDRVAGRDLRRDLWPDLDGDGVGAITDPVHDCREQLTDHVTRTGDCDDADDVVFPGAAEVCDGVDNNCGDGIADEGRVYRWFDGDGDGFGVGDSDWDCPTTFDTSWVPQGGDCDDNATAIHPDAVEVCDHLDNDCDQLYDIEGGHSLYVPRYVDGDGDGWGAGGVVQACAEEPGFTQDSGDCADDDADRFPGNPERCDEVDQDCDDEVADDGRQPWYLDEDRDGAGSEDVPTDWSQRTGGAPYPAVVCATQLSPLFHWEAAGGDCDDADPTRRPGAAEICDDIDSNCNGWADERTTPHFPDDDGDGTGAQGAASAQRCPNTAGWVENQLDCDDTNRDRFIGNPERCDEVDQDCDGDVRDDGRRVWWYDGDGDGYGATYAGQSPLDVCDSLLPNPTRWVTRGQDCDDVNPAVSPGQPEVCDGTDNDCNTATAEPYAAHYPDVDRDGYGDLDARNPTMRCRVSGDAWVEDHTDCDDSLVNINPRAADPCDDVDQDCDGDPWEGQDVNAVVDWDHDGYGEAGVRPTTVCRPELCPLVDPIGGTVDDAGRDDVDPLTGDYLEPCWAAWTADVADDDCDDEDHATHPNAVEVCDGKRNTCDECTHIDDGSACPDTYRFEWWGSVYLVRTDTDPSPTRTSVIETWQSAADWCRSHGYKLWWPDQDAWFFTGLFPEPRSLAVIDELFWQSTTYYHTGLRGTCPNDPAQTIGWMLWDPLTDECTPFSSDTMRLLGLSAAYSVDSVARVSLYNIQNFPYANAESRNINDLGRTVCELDDGDLLDSNYILPEDNPRCP